MHVSVEEIKKHLNIDFSDDDEYLASLIETSEASVEMYTSSLLSDYVVEGTLNPMLKHVIKIFAGTLYANRESVSTIEAKPVPYTLEYLIKPFRKYT